MDYNRLLDSIESLLFIALESPLSSSHTYQGLRIPIKQAVFKKMSLIELLNAFQVKTKVYFSNKENTKELLGIDCLHTIAYHKKNISYFIKTQCGENIRFYGSTSFSANKISSKLKQRKWRRLNQIGFVLPLFEFIREDKMIYFQANFKDKKDVMLNWLSIRKTFVYTQSVEALSLDGLNKLPYTYQPTEKQWYRLLFKAKKLLYTKSLSKLVLARVIKIKLKQSNLAINIFLALQNNQKDTYKFFFQTHTNNVFISFSPEKLFTRINQELFSEAIAGSRPRGEDEKEDALLEEQLRSSLKEQQEHTIVSDFLESYLQKISMKVIKIADKQILKLNYIQHLFSSFRATLIEKDSIDDMAILQNLHPTPAMAGFPKKTAIKYINKFESFDRGWYSAPIGYISQHHSDFAVGIRSMLVIKNNLYIYSGAGIVEHSSSHQEWHELNYKLRFLKPLFSLD